MRSNAASRQINLFTLKIFVRNSNVNVFEHSACHCWTKKNHNCRECCLQDKHFCPGLICKLRFLTFVRTCAYKNLCLDIPQATLKKHWIIWHRENSKKSEYIKLKESSSLNSVTPLNNQCKQERTKHHGLFPPASASCKLLVQGASIIESRLPAEYNFLYISSQNDDLVRSPGSGLKNK